MTLTRKQAIDEHRKMWNWIADETEKRGEIVKKRLHVPIITVLNCQKEYKQTYKKS